MVYEQRISVKKFALTNRSEITIFLPIPQFSITIN